jgi:predicted DNA binding protein
MTLRQIADAEGVSHQAVAEILERALRKVRKALLAKGITLEDLL